LYVASSVFHTTRYLHSRIIILMRHPKQSALQLHNLATLAKIMQNLEVLIVVNMKIKMYTIMAIDTQVLVKR